VVAGSTRDITNRKNLERALRDVQLRMEAALAAGSIGTWAWDTVKNQFFADRNLAQLLSLSEAEANGGPIENALAKIHSEDIDRVRTLLAAALEKGDRYETEYRVVNADRSLRWLAARGTVQRDTVGRAISMPGAVVDITERKELESRIGASMRELEAAKHALERQAGDLEEQVKERTARLQDTVSELESFSYSISHDLRGPLRVMQSFAQALREDCGEQLSAVGLDYIRRIVAAGERMDRVIQDVLVYSRIARTELALERVALEEFLPSLLDGYPGFDDALADIVIATRLPVVLANRAALTQCVANLLDNAIKFVAPGVRPRVQISAREADDRAFLSIADNGIGIPRKAHDAIFGVFYRLEQAYAGTGIGLAIVHKAVERMGGHITVDSEPGTGSTFTFDLALATPTP
jgi:PAS domain S-box-containing protein